MANSFAEAFKLAKLVDAEKKKTIGAESSTGTPAEPKPNEIFTLQLATGATNPVEKTPSRNVIHAKRNSSIKANQVPSRIALATYHKGLPQNASGNLRSTSSAPKYPHLAASRSRPQPIPNKVTVHLAATARLALQGIGTATSQIFKRSEVLGRQCQLHTEPPTSVREVVMGFDFGTSSSKVVVGDRALRLALAVPFRDASGIDSYLLPARLFRDVDFYSLHGGPQLLNDLKLALLASPDNVDLQTQVVAYLALAIREVRGWLFSAHAESYLKTEIVWSFALGLPAQQALNEGIALIFEKLGIAAWTMAGSISEVSHELCKELLKKVRAPSNTNEEIEVVVMPEIAAQIFGFVSSNQFDEHDRNIFLIADVGAGTVDSCLFRAVPNKGNRWSFEVFTSAVEPTGVMNLHRQRIAWWQDQLAPYAQAAALQSQLQNIKFGTDQELAIPESFRDYLKDVDVNFTGNAMDPDKTYFRIPLLRQVQSRTLYRAISDSLLGKRDIEKIPFYLCGGGSRLTFYHDLRSAITKFDGCSWLTTVSREMAIPNDLRADGLHRKDFDRLSVAYGLSMLNLTGISFVPKMKKLPIDDRGVWQQHYVDKDEI